MTKMRGIQAKRAEEPSCFQCLRADEIRNHLDKNKNDSSNHRSSVRHQQEDNFENKYSICKLFLGVCWRCFPFRRNTYWVTTKRIVDLHFSLARRYVSLKDLNHVLANTVVLATSSPTLNFVVV